MLETPECNLGIDLAAARVVFNHSDIPLWLVPRNLYQQCLVSGAALRAPDCTPRRTRGAPLRRTRHAAVRIGAAGHGLAETYVLGDSPLVLLTALQSFFQPDPSSSDYALRPCPELDDHGRFSAASGRDVRVYSRLDVRLMFEDLFLKVEELAAWLATP